jgi:acetylornithine aminotransferase/acetylornithine/N-succinyldiaminopimelate aminotransferase
MKEISPAAAPLVRNQFEAVRELVNRHVVPSYARFDLAFARGSGSYLWDVSGRRYLDLGGGIAVCSLGHANPEITRALIEQSQKLVHVSNLYYHEAQGRLAQQIVKQIAPGKVFFCNSGAEANEGLFKLARRFGHDTGRFEIIATHHSFHGRTLAGIAATGQEKVKKGFEPMVHGFRHVPFNDLPAMREAISPATAAILIEGVQGEGGITPATPEYLLGLRELCDQKKLLLFLDGVQCGHFRTGRFQSFQRILEGVEPAAGVPSAEPERGGTGRQENRTAFLPDGVAMAKSLGGGFPIGAFWVRDKYADLLGAGTHATTFGGTPLGCAVALKVLEVIQRDQLAENARHTGDFLKAELQRLIAIYPRVLKTVRGLGFMLGIQLVEKEGIPAFAGSEKTASIQFVNRLHEAGILTVPAGAQVVRLLPPLNLTRQQAEEGIGIIEEVLKPLG